MGSEMCIRDRVPLDQLSNENVSAVQEGICNLQRHLENLQKFGVKPVVAINQFSADTEAEVEVVRQVVSGLGVETILCSHWANGGEGTRELAEAVVRVCDGGESNFAPLYPDELPLWEKIETVAREIYRADGITASNAVRKQIERYQEEGYGHFPVCIAKTQYSFSTDPKLPGAPTGYEIPIREVKLSNGAEFLVVICGDLMTMPGLPRVPAANHISLDEDGVIQGLS